MEQSVTRYFQICNEVAVALRRKFVEKVKFLFSFGRGQQSGTNRILGNVRYHLVHITKAMRILSENSPSQTSQSLTTSKLFNMAAATFW